MAAGFQIESGYDPRSRAVGDGNDGSDAINIGQWNGDRAQAFNRFASTNGRNPMDPQTGLDFAHSELQGPENGAWKALMAARSPEEAQKAAIGYWRPGGWSADNPQGADSFNARLNATNAIMAAGNGGSLPAGVSAYTDPATATGAMNAISATFGKPGSQVALDPATASIEVPGYSGKFTRKQAEDASESDDKTPGTDEWDKAFAAMPKPTPGPGAAPAPADPGALSTANRLGGGLLDWANSDKGHDFGSSLMRVGAALMARDNSQGAYAMQNAIPKNTEDNSKDLSATHVMTNRDGTKSIIRIGSDGKVISEETKGTPYVPPEKPTPESVIKDWGTDDGNFSTAKMLAERAHSVANSIMDGDVDMRIDSQGKAFINNYTGGSTKNDQLIKEANTLIDRAVSQRLIAEHARPTQANMAQARMQILPPGAQYDNGQMVGAMIRIARESTDVMNSSYGTNAERASNYPGLDKDGAKMRTYKETNDAYAKRFQDLEEKSSNWLTDRDQKRKAKDATTRPGGAYKPGSILNPPGSTAPAAPAAPAVTVPPTFSGATSGFSF
jgi:hypothetical protein